MGPRFDRDRRSRAYEGAPKDYPPLVLSSPAMATALEELLVRLAAGLALRASGRSDVFIYFQF